MVSLIILPGKICSRKKKNILPEKKKCIIWVTPPPFWRFNQCGDHTGTHDKQCLTRTVEKKPTKATCFHFPQHSNMPCPNIRNSRWPTAISHISFTRSGR